MYCQRSKSNKIHVQSQGIKMYLCSVFLKNCKIREQVFVLLKTDVMMMYTSNNDNNNSVSNLTTTSLMACVHFYWLMKKSFYFHIFKFQCN